MAKYITFPDFYNKRYKILNELSKQKHVKVILAELGAYAKINDPQKY